MALADRRGDQVGGRGEPAVAQELPQWLDHEQRLALVRRTLLVGGDDVVGCEGGDHRNRGA